MNYGIVSDIKRFAVHDGDGIRTTVFLKGCSLKCVWCHNPESIGCKPEVAYYKAKCLNCGECVSVCQSGAHKQENGVHIFDKSLCTGCGKCEEACLGDALKFYGRKMTAKELLPLLLEDRDYYEKSGGGVTLSGGECLCQADFCLELLKLLKDEEDVTIIVSDRHVLFDFGYYQVYTRLLDGEFLKYDAIVSTVNTINVVSEKKYIQNKLYCLFFYDYKEEKKRRLVF